MKILSNVCLQFTRRMSSINTNPKVCIIGAGPAGFYAAMHLSKNLPTAEIDILEKLPVPFGLIRYGVAPDHPEVKNVINQFTKVANQKNVNFYGNIALGQDILLSQLQEFYDAVLLTYGAGEDKYLGIENENAHNVIAARHFVGWYNGFPSAADLKVDLSGSTAVIVGQGNVALDVARILTTPVDILRKTDVTEHALMALSESKLKEVYLVGRRGPLQVAFTIKELREQLKINNCKTIWRTEDFNGVADLVNDLPRPRKRLTELMLKSLNENNSSSLLDSQNVKYFKPIFFRSPSKFIVNDKNQINGIELFSNTMVGDNYENQKCIQTNNKEIIDCSLAFRSIGYKSVNADSSIKFNSNGLVENDKGRVIGESSDGLAKVYVAGWLGSGPVGVILHTMGNAFQVAKTICKDLNDSNASSKPGFREVRNIISKKNTQIVDWAGWEKIDKYEFEQGKLHGKPREKIVSLDKMIEIATSNIS